MKDFNVIELELIQKRKFKDRELDVILGPDEVIELAIQHIGSKTNENLLAFMLNAKNEVIGVHTVSIGNVNSTMCNPKTILQVAILSNAVAIIMVHNHPSGDLTPSTADIESYKQLSKMFDMWELSLLDSIIVNDYYGISIREKIAEL